MYQPAPRRSNSKVGQWVAVFLCFASGLSWALDSDRYQPIDVAADSAILDDKAGKAIYRGGVVLTQGSLKIQADKLTIEADPQGKVEKVIATGDLAQFTQLPNDSDKPIEAQANTVEYYVANERIVLIDNARVVQNDNLFEGNIIEYDIRDQKLQAHGKSLTAEGGDEQKPGRVKMVLQPQTQDAQPASQETSAAQPDSATTDSTEDTESKPNNAVVSDSSINPETQQESQATQDATPQIEDNTQPHE